MSLSIVMCFLIYFVNLKIKSIQSFGYTHRGRMYVHIFIGIHIHICIIKKFIGASLSVLYDIQKKSAITYLYSYRTGRIL
jgi:hypothetical protein